MHLNVTWSITCRIPQGERTNYNMKRGFHKTLLESGESRRDGVPWVNLSFAGFWPRFHQVISEIRGPELRMGSLP